MHVDFCVDNNLWYYGYHLNTLPQIGSTIFVRDSSKTGKDTRFTGKVVNIHYALSCKPTMINVLTAIIYLQTDKVPTEIL